MSRVMLSSWEPIFQAFFFRVQNSPEFFNYYNVDEREAMELARIRSKGYLVEAIARITSQCSPDVDFLDYDEELEEFGFPVTKEEVDLIVSLMFEMFMQKDIVKLRVHNQLLTSQDLKSAYGVGYMERRTYDEMFEKIVLRNNTLIDSYISKDRLTGKRKSIDYGS